MNALLLNVLLAAGIVPGAERAEALPGADWISMGLNCRVFAAGDLDGDGWADFLTINGNRELCVARSVNGWKSAGWRAVAPGVEPEALEMRVLADDGEGRRGVVILEEQRLVLLRGYADGGFAERHQVAAPEGRTLVRLAPEEEGAAVVDDTGASWRLDGGQLVRESAATAPADSAGADSAAGPSVSPPPYGSDETTEIARLVSGFAPEGGKLAWSVFRAERPHRHLVVRMAVVESPDPADRDLDGLSDEREAQIGTDPRDRDTDGDGLLDGWEVHGLPRDVDLGDRVGLFDPAGSTEEQERQLSPLRQDVLVAVSYHPGVDVERFRRHMPRIDGLYRALDTRNPDGSTGIRIHFIELGEVSREETGQHWAQVGNRQLPRHWRGLVHWMQVTGGGGGQSSQTGDMGSSSNGWAVFAHELGHQLSLSHTGDSRPNLCPLYTSLMNYAYNYSFGGDGNAVHFSDGRFRGVELDERSLVERLDFPYEQVKFLEQGPFRFTLKDDGDGTTLIDWNHNGVFDDEPVEADINYGYSTHAGDRKTHELIGSAPSLAYVGDTCLLAAAAHKQDKVTVKAYLGDAKWSDAVGVPGSDTRFDPVLAGGAEGGAIFIRRSTEWRVANVSVKDGKPEVDAPQALPDLPLADLSAIRLGGRYLLITRFSDDRLEARWLTPGEKPELSEPIGLTSRSQVPVGLAANPADGTITMVGAAPDEKAGPFCMQIVPVTVKGDELHESTPVRTRNGRANHCTSRPVPVYCGEGAEAQLAIFHSGWPAGNGTWTGYRTIQVKNKELDGGWLTNQMYDEWTRSRVAPGFADGPQGAIYAFRWDPGDHRDWKVNTMFVAHEGWGIDDAPMRDFDDAAQMSRWGIRHSILNMIP